MASNYLSRSGIFQEIPEEAIAWANQFPADSNRLHETVIGQVAARIAPRGLGRDRSMGCNHALRISEPKSHGQSS